MPAEYCTDDTNHKDAHTDEVIGFTDEYYEYARHCNECGAKWTVKVKR